LQLGNLGAISTREILHLPAIDALLTDPVPDRLIDDPEFLGHVRNGAMLVNDQCGRISTKLLRIANTTTRRLF
jgi:hypothetical protein